MDSFLRVLTPFFGAPKNYQEMLWKIAVADFWLTLNHRDRHTMMVAI
jgi:hypothetical protein